MRARHDAPHGAGSARAPRWSPSQNERIYLIFAVYFLALFSVLVFKHHEVLSEWPFDEAYVIQQYHNWKSGYPIVTIQPNTKFDQVGEKPFQDTNIQLTHHVYGAFYWLWPHPETLIMLYALLISLSVLTLHYFLGQIRVEPRLVPWLVLGWLFYPLQLKTASYSYCSQLTTCGTFYFLYLGLLVKESRFAVLGGLALLLAREEAVFLIPPTLLLFPKKWRTLLWHFFSAFCMLSLLKTHKRMGMFIPWRSWPNIGSPQSLAFYWNFLSTEPLLWLATLVSPLSLLVTVAFLILISLQAAPIWFHQFTFLGAGPRSMGAFRYYSLLLAFAAAAACLGIARLKRPVKQSYVYLFAALMIGTGLIYLFRQSVLLKNSMLPEIGALHYFIATQVSDADAVVTDPILCGVFANRDQIYVYQQPPRGFAVTDVFSKADVAVIYTPDLMWYDPNHIQGPKDAPWTLVMRTPNYSFYKKIRK